MGKSKRELLARPEIDPGSPFQTSELMTTPMIVMITPTPTAQPWQLSLQMSTFAN